MGGGDRSVGESVVWIDGGIFQDRGKEDVEAMAIVMCEGDKIHC